MVNRKFFIENARNSRFEVAFVAASQPKAKKKKAKKKK